LLLGYLAFRGIQNDRALLEKRRLEEHHKIAELVIRSIDVSIFEVERTFLNAVATGGAPQNCRIGHQIY